MAQIYNSQLDAFDLYHQIHEHEKSRPVLGGPGLPALGHATAGSIGAAISNVVTYPLALIVTRLQIQRSLSKRSSARDGDKYQSIPDAVKKICNHDGGIAGFYTGIFPDTIKTIADAFLFFLAYNFLRQKRLNARGNTSKQLPVIDELSVGFLAGAFSKFLTTPIANIVTRQQAASMTAKDQPTKAQRSSVREIALQIRSEKGLPGFWSGYSASLVLTLNPSLTFLLFETFKRLSIPRHKRSDPPHQATFLIAAISKAIASTITYPFSLAKSRAQASSKAVNEKDTEEQGTAKNIHAESILSTEKARAKAPSNVFSTILQISRSEGLAALYEGLGGEVLKGFFSHGFTMIVKQIVHGLIIQVYFATLGLLQRLPNAQSAIILSKDRTVQAVTATQNPVQPLVSSAIDRSREAAIVMGDKSNTLIVSTPQAVLAASTFLTREAEGVDFADNPDVHRNPSLWSIWSAPAMAHWASLLYSPRASEQGFFRRFDGTSLDISGNLVAALEDVRENSDDCLDHRYGTKQTNQSTSSREPFTNAIGYITGANQGVGFECAKNLLLSSPTYHVILGSRSLSNGEAALSTLHALPDLQGTASTVQLDVCSEASVLATVSTITASHGRLDILVNNAGVGEKSDDDGQSLHKRFRHILETNTIGPVLVTESFLPLLRTSPSSPKRIIFVSSSMGSLSQAADPGSHYYKSVTGMQFSRYRASKAALNMILIEYHKQLKDEGIEVMGADPGLVVTNFVDQEMVKGLGAPGADVGGGTVAEVVKGGGERGRVVGRYGVSPW
ncbi:MAG: hypothetical protein Q9220_006629 [cf. Caloplaca sp. 1 TL-2023]